MKPERIAELQDLKAEAKAKTKGKKPAAWIPECDKRPTEL